MSLHNLFFSIPLEFLDNKTIGQFNNKGLASLFFFKVKKQYTRRFQMKLT